MFRLRRGAQPGPRRPGRAAKASASLARPRRPQPTLRKFLRTEKIQACLFIKPSHESGAADPCDAGVQRRADGITPGYYVSSEELPFFVTKSSVQVKGDLAFFSFEYNSR